MRIFTLTMTAMLAACNGSDNSSADEGAPGTGGPGAEAAGDAEDTGGYSDFAHIDGAPFEPNSIEGTFFAEEDPVWVLIAKEGANWIHIENYAGFGGANGPETRTLDATEVNYATCGICVMLKTGCTPHGDHAHCSTTYMPEAGSRITFDELGADVGEPWAGSVSPIRFVEVSMNTSTFETTPVEGGDQIELDAWDFDIILQAQ